MGIHFYFHDIYAVGCLLFKKGEVKRKCTTNVYKEDEKEEQKEDEENLKLSSKLPTKISPFKRINSQLN